MNKSFRWVVGVLVGMLALSAGLLSLGSRDWRAFPDADSYSPSGTRAFRTLLEQSGYPVRIDRRPRPRLREGDLAIAFFRRTSNTFLTELELEETFETNEEGESTGPRQNIERFVQNGGAALYLPIGEDFPTRSKQAPAGRFEVEAGEQTLMLLDSALFGEEENFYPNEFAEFGAFAWMSGQRPFLLVSQPGKTGGLFVLRDGIIATNRFIDQQDHARALLKIVATSGAKRVVFTEATFGNVRDGGLVEVLGPWAQAGFLQAMFLFVVIVYTLGKPFGTPDERRATQRGSRDLVDAISSVLVRRRDGLEGLDTSLRLAHRHLCRNLRLPASTSWQELRRHLPEDVAERYQQVLRLSKVERVADSEALRSVIQLERAVSDLYPPTANPAHRRSSRPGPRTR